MALTIHEPTAAQRLLRFVQRRERALIVAWLAAAALLLAILAVWSLAPGGAERAVEARDAYWVGEVDRGAELVEARRFDQAARHLAALDQRFPARFVKHRLDRERERLLALLARAYAELDRRALARETLERLTAFDPKNFASHALRGDVERRFGDFAAAREAYLRALAIHPSHLPSVEALIGMSFDAGRYELAIEDYRRYLDAYLLARIALRFDGDRVEIEVPVDGREHALEAALVLPAPWSGEVCVETRGFSARIAAIEVEPPVRVGVVEPREPQALEPDASWSARGGTALAIGEISAADPTSSIGSPPIRLARGASRIRVRVALFKALPAETWRQVEKSAANRLAHEFLREARERSRAGGCLEAGSIAAD